MSSAAFDAMAARVRNWGRWGDDDVLGTINLIDDAARLRAAASVVSGQALSLSLPLSEAEGIQLGFIKGRTNPSMTMTRINVAEDMAPDGPSSQRSSAAACFGCGMTSSEAETETVRQWRSSARMACRLASVITGTRPRLSAAPNWPVAELVA